MYAPGIMTDSFFSPLLQAIKKSRIVAIRSFIMIVLRLGIIKPRMAEIIFAGKVIKKNSEGSKQENSFNQER